MTWLEIVRTGTTILLFVGIAFLGWAMFLHVKTFKLQSSAFDSMVRAFTEQNRTVADVHSWTVPPEEWAAVIELHRQIREMGSELRNYLIYCHSHAGYVRYDNQGYTPIRDEARHYTAAEGLILVLDRSRNSDPFDCYVLVAVGKQELAECPYCRQAFYAPEHHDPLRKHAEYCESWPRESES